MNIRHRILSLVGLLFLAAASAASAQDFYRVEMRPVRGFMPNMDQLSSPVDHIDPVSRKMHLEIPLASLPKGHGGSGFDLNLVYDSHIWDLMPEPIPPPFPWDQDPNTQPAAGYRLGVAQGTRAGWNFNIDHLTLDLEEFIPPDGIIPDCNVNLSWSRYRLRLRLLDGSDHVLQMKDWAQPGYTGSGFYPFDPGGRCHYGATYLQMASGWLTYYTTDGSYIKVETYADTTQDWSHQSFYVYFPDGRRIILDSEGKHLYDANGNGVHIGNFCTDTGCTQIYTRIVDDVGHEIQISEVWDNPNGPTTTVTTVGPNGPMNWTLNWEQFQLGLDGRVYAVKAPQDGSPWDELLPLNANLLALKYVQLPLATPVPADQAPPVWNSYAFGYADDSNDGYGQVDYLRTPTGAVFQYRYTGEGGTSNSADIAHEIKVRERRVSDGLGPDLVWIYGSGGVPAGIGGATTVTNPDGSQTTFWYGAAAGAGSSLSGYLDSSIPNNRVSGDVVYRIDEPNGRVIKRVWSQNRAPNGSPYTGNNAFVKRETVTVGDMSGAPGLTAVTERVIDKNGNLLQTIEYDWVPYDPSGPENGSTVDRITEFTFHAAVSDYKSGANLAKAYWNPHFSPLSPGQSRRLDAVRRKEVRDASGAVVAASEFDYDDAFGSGNVTAAKNWDSVKSLSAPGLGALNGANSQVLTRSYDSHGNLSDIYEPEVRTRITYDAFGFPVHVDYAPGTNERRSWDYSWHTDSGTLTSKTDRDNNITTEYTYDVVGRPRTVVEAGVRKTETVYDNANRKVTVKKDLATPGDGKLQVTTEYDPLGRTTLVRTAEPGNPDGIKVKSTYYSTLNRTIQSSPYRTTADATLEWTCTQKDASQRVTAVAMFKSATEPTDCESTVNRTGITRTIYNGNWTSTIDPASKHRAEGRDAQGRMVEVMEDPGGALDYHTYYAYDALGNLTHVYQGAQIRAFQYSSLGRLLSANNPESQTTFYAYSEIGDLLIRTDSRGVSTTLTYDPMRRIRTKSYSDGTAPVTYTYYLWDAAAPKVGQLQSVASDTAFNQNDSFDVLGRVTSSSHSIAGDSTRSFVYTYWLNNSLQTVTNPSGRVLQYDVDDAGRTARVYAGSTIYGDLTVSNSPYTADGRIAEIKLGNDLWETRQYQAPGVPTLFKVGTTQGANDKLELEYNFSGTANNGNLESQVIRRPGGTWTQYYEYDGINRLLTAKEVGGWIRNYGYDRYGNRWVNGTGLQWDDPHEPIADTNFDPTNNRLYVAGSTFDAAGNQTTFVPWTLSYDAENRITTVTSSSSGSGEFSYDGDGRRVKKTWTPSGGSPITTYYFYNALGQLAAEYSTETSAAGTSYVHADMLGSTRMVTNAARDTVECYDYEPFGRMLSAGVNGRNTGCYPPNPDSQISSNVPQKFTGKERDGETRLDYFGARYYSASQGRFTGADKAFVDEHQEDPQSWNLYEYVRNKPLMAVDLDGHQMVPHPTQLLFDRRTQGARDFLIGVAKGFINSNLGEDARLFGMALKTLGVEQQAASNHAQQVGMDNSDSAVSIGMAILGVVSSRDSSAPITQGKFQVGPYKVLREFAEAGLDSHHVGQKGLMKHLVENYDPSTAPSILVPKAGHTIGEGVVSRSMSGFNSARDVIARDIKELRRVYPDVPNSQLQRLIEMNKQMYPEVRK